MGAFENNAGKVGAEVFKEMLLPFGGANRSEVICGPQFGVDSAVIDLGNGEALAVSSDPLSLIPGLGMEVSAWLSIHLLVNDMLTTGFAPQYAQFVLNLPPSLSKADFQEYWKHIHALCEQHDIAITGGHTGQIEGQNSTISGGGTMFLKAPKNQILTSNHAEPGNLIVMTKQAALVSSSLLARAFPETVTSKCGQLIQQKAAKNFWQLSVKEEALLAAQTLKLNAELRAMHDVTEGGVLGALAEMATASGCGFEVDADAIPVGEEVKAVTDLFEIDPLLSIGAGSMVMALREDAWEKLDAAFKKAGISATVVGRFTEASSGQILVKNGEQQSFEFDGEDPYWMAFFNALNAGWK